ncbi:unnamed protein product [Meganyctiphanes norvegica]|uniref:Uncharacterized protein n=1 Tax=Meganyctiphanes norvegica TaxID=48144 RepID=A0AAV2QEG5_MEGNR
MHLKISCVSLYFSNQSTLEDLKGFAGRFGPLNISCSQRPAMICCHLWPKLNKISLYQNTAPRIPPVQGLSLQTLSIKIEPNRNTNIQVLFYLINQFGYLRFKSNK